MVRSLDVVARIGGDEFVVLSSRDRESALRLGETIVSAVSQHKYRIAKDSIRFGVSIGIAVCAHGSTDLRTLMSRADKALYSATDRKSVVSGKSVAVSVELGGRRIIKK